MSARSVYRRRARLVLLTGLLAGTLTVFGCGPKKPAEAQAKADPNAGYGFATVNYPQLASEHPSFGELKQLDEQIALVEQKKQAVRAAAYQELQKKGRGRMQSAVADAKAKLEAERNAIEGEMAGLQASLQGQMESELRGIQQRLQKELEGDIKKVQGDDKPESVEPPKMDPRIDGQLDDFRNNLAMVRERNLAARRLELEKRIGDEVNAKKAEVDGQIASYEADLSAQYQSERLNLQLAAQNASDEAAKTAAQTRLEAINDEIEQKKSARRAELEAGYASVRAQKSAQLQNELEAYTAELNQEVARKVTQKRAELGEVVAAPQQKRPSGPTAEVQARIAEMQGRMASELEARKSELSAQMSAEAEKARARLKAKQEQVEAELKRMEEVISVEMEKELAKLNPETQKKIEAVDKEVKGLQDQRKQLADKIASDISREVGEVAAKKEIDMVVGGFEFSTYDDITDQAMVAIKTMGSSK